MSDSALFKDIEGVYNGCKIVYMPSREEFCWIKDDAIVYSHRKYNKVIDEIDKSVKDGYFNVKVFTLKALLSDDWSGDYQPITATILRLSSLDPNYVWIALGNEKSSVPTSCLFEDNEENREIANKAQELYNELSNTLEKLTNPLWLRNEQR